MNRLELQYLVVAVALAIALTRLELSVLLVLGVQIALFTTWHLFGFFCSSVLSLPSVVFFTIKTVILAKKAVSTHGPRFPEWTPEMEMIQVVTHAMTTNYADVMAREENANILLQLCEVIARLRVRSIERQYNSRIEIVPRKGLEHIWIRSDAPSPNKHTFVFVYIHGGGFVICGPHMYIEFGNQLRQDLEKALGAAEVEIDVFLPAYRKAPKFPYPIPQQDAQDIYEYLRDELEIPPERIILAGESAGGGLVLSTLIALRDKNEKQPLAGIVLYPWCDFVDCVEPNQSATELPQRGENCMLAKAGVVAYHRAIFHGRTDVEFLKRASPVYSDLTGLPSMLVQVGTADYLYEDSLKLMANAERCGLSDCEFDEYKNVLHGFVTMSAKAAPQSVEALGRMCDFAANKIKNAI